MRRALVPLLLVALVLTGCGNGGVPHRTWVTKVCQALGPWRDRITALNGQAADQMKTATTPAQTRDNLLRLLDGARQASEDARAKVAGAGVPDVADGTAIEERFVAAVTAVRDAYAKAHKTVQGLSDADKNTFYAGVGTAMDALNKEYGNAGVDARKLASADLRKDFDEVPACA
ncbi:MAG: hypothetical protein AUI14_12860 [Actinobacteria bacterium 13_2_20CM_2_71_6]|nr:MAG: hypothetical protein AUI14_12860 [Actinobacteria bacterium 13_2_20CM_2_71_6]